MATRYPLDTRFAIAEAFDSNLLRGECTVNEIAATVGANRKSVGRTLLVMDFRLVQKPSPVRERIPARWEPPRNWPKLKRHSRITRAIMEAYDSGRWSGRCYVRDLAPMLDLPEETVAHGLKRLRFKVVKRAHLKFIRMEPAVWSPPRRWPDLLQKQRELRQSGLSTGSVMRATDLSAEITAIINDAVKLLDIEDVPLFKRGALKLKIREVVQEVYRKAAVDNIARQELASWLGERPDANIGYLQSRIEGYTRFASKRLCQHCGNNPAKLRDNHHRATEPIGVAL